MGISSYRCWLFIVPVLERGFFLIADMPLGDSVLSKGNIASPSKKIKQRIVLVDYINQLNGRGYIVHDAVMEGGRDSDPF
jgi:hypothetical protein